MSFGQTRQTHTPGGSQLARDPTPTTTRSQTAGNPSSVLTKDQLLSLPYEINNADEGLDFLTSKAFIPSGVHPSLQQLSVALLHIAQMKGVPATSIKAIHSVSFLLETEITNQISQATSDKVIVGISSHVTNLQTAVSNLTTQPPKALSTKPIMDQLTKLTSSVETSQ